MNRASGAAHLLPYSSSHGAFSILLPLAAACWGAWYVWSNPQGLSGSVRGMAGLGAVVVGGIGFVIGFFGPGCRRACT